jgi:hypothetical protein
MKCVNDEALVTNTFLIRRPKIVIKNKTDNKVINACKVTERVIVEYVYSILEWAPSLFYSCFENVETVYQLFAVKH